ncbi:MAG: hypothetical protein LAN37_16235 [Acidobacteriia bacterium]|nr:hypothetical protein [Terriglobia bacterium]
MALEPMVFGKAGDGQLAPETARLEWSRWSRCQSSISLALTPPLPGIFALAEEVISENASALVGNRRMIAVFDVQATDDLSHTLHGLFAPGSPLRPRIESGRCFVRFAVVPVRTQREAACIALRQWLAASTEAGSAIAEAFAAAPPSSTHQEDKEDNGVNSAPSLPEGS